MPDSRRNSRSDDDDDEKKERKNKHRYVIWVLCFVFLWIYENNYIQKKGTGEGWGEGGGYWRDHEKKGQDPDEIDAHGNKVDNGYN